MAINCCSPSSPNCTVPTYVANDAGNFSKIPICPGAANGALFSVEIPLTIHSSDAGAPPKPPSPDIAPVAGSASRLNGICVVPGAGAGVGVWQCLGAHEMVPGTTEQTGPGSIYVPAGVQAPTVQACYNEDDTTCVNLQAAGPDPYGRGTVYQVSPFPGISLSTPPATTPAMSVGAIVMLAAGLATMPFLLRTARRRAPAA